MPHYPAGYECCDLGYEPLSGARLIRLTTSALISNLIYCEQPYGSPDGKRIALMRAADFSFGETRSLLLADLERRSLHLVEKEFLYRYYFGHTAWGEWLYYVNGANDLMRISLLSFAKERVSNNPLPPGANIDSITPDGRYLIGWSPATSDAGPPIVRYDTHTGEQQVIFTDIENNNPHLQVEWATGTRLVMQLVYGVRRMGQGLGEGAIRGVGLLVMDIDGGNLRELPLSRHWTAQSSGHMAWIADMGKVACCVEWNRGERKHDARHPQGNLAIAGADDKDPFIFTAPEHAFYHVSISRCGTYFVCDDFMDFEMDAPNGRFGPARIVVGNLKTGKYRVLVTEVGSNGMCGCSWSEPVPYFTADNKRVIYNASPFGINQVHMAELADDFLPSLD